MRGLASIRLCSQFDGLGTEGRGHRLITAFEGNGDNDPLPEARVVRIDDFAFDNIEAPMHTNV